MENKTILITGVQGSVGGFVARKFKQEGWAVAGIDRKEIAEEDAFSDIYIPCDVRDREALGQAVAELEGKIKIDALFTAAGKELLTGFEETPIAEWKDCLDVWLGGTVNACAAAAPYFAKRKKGKIIIFSPDYTKKGGDCILNATAAGSLHGFAKSLGTELAEYGVTVNALWASLDFSLESIAATAFCLANGSDYITAQVISVTGETGGCHESFKMEG